MTARRLTDRLRGAIARAAAVALAALSFALPLGGCTSEAASPDLPPHLIEKPDANPVRPIDGFETAELSDFSLPLSDDKYRARVDELYQTVVDLGRKPILRDDDPVKPIYDAAVAVLDKYILNAWHTEVDGEYRKVHSIHDWLVYYVDYDFELYDRYHGGEAVDDNPAFDIDGVFLNKRAVCNGLSRAASFLCAVEGVRSMRVTGTYLGAPHAWNKVNIGGEWYNMDVTADAANYTVDKGASYKKQLTHGYFLLSDKTYRRFSPNGDPSSAHVFTSTVKSEKDFDYYTGMVSVGDRDFGMTVTSKARLFEIFDAVDDAGGRVGKLELKLRFPEKDENSVNDGDIYAREIKDAYRRLGSSDFSSSSLPYVRYPNGVYLFLMYF